MTSLITKVLGVGPSATVSAELPDLDYFSGRGGKDTIPLWRDADASVPNVTQGLLEVLAGEYDEPVSPTDLFAYVYALLACPNYADQFSEELTIPGPRVPLTKRHDLFSTGVSLGRDLIRLHTYGTRLSDSQGSPAVPQGQARSIKGIPSEAESYPEDYAYDPVSRTLTVGDGEFGPVDPRVWEYSVSGLEIVKSWIAYRLKDRAGRSSSPLDDIRPQAWTRQLTQELLELIWVLEATVNREPELNKLLADVIESPVFTASELPDPTPEQKKPPARPDKGATHTQERFI